MVPNPMPAPPPIAPAAMTVLSATTTQNQNQNSDQYQHAFLLLFLTDYSYRAADDRSSQCLRTDCRGPRPTNQYRVHLRLPHLKQERAVGRHEGDLPHLLFLALPASLNCADGCNFGAVFEFLLREIEVPQNSLAAMIFGVGRGKTIATMRSHCATAMNPANIISIRFRTIESVVSLAGSEGFTGSLGLPPATSLYGRGVDSRTSFAFRSCYLDLGQEKLGTMRFNFKSREVAEI